MRSAAPILGWWKLPAAVGALGLACFAYGWLTHGPAIPLVMSGSVLITAALLMAAVIRMVIPERDVGALHIRSLALDVALYTLAAVLVLVGAAAVYWRTQVYRPLPPAERGVGSAPYEPSTPDDVSRFTAGPFSS